MNLTASPVTSSATYCTPYSDPTQSQGYSNTFTSLPEEIKQAIFSSVPDVACLKSLVLTCSSFYHSFLNAQSLILDEVLRGQIGADVISLATVVSVSRLQPWSKEGVVDILSQLFEHRAPAPWTLPGALYVSQLHGHVEFFVADFAATKLSKETQSKPSISEESRIRRSFYLFELYCNLFRARRSNKNRFSSYKQRDLFFQKFAPWENEQLACVHDYLFDQLSVGFNEVAAHDVEWGEWSVDYVDDYHLDANPYKEHYLSLGLEYLRKVVTATDYDKTFDLIYPNFGLDNCFLFEGLTTQDETDGLYLPLEDYTQADREMFIRKPFFVDDEIGPMKAWMWAHAESTRAGFYFREEQYALRQQGYVMWDYSRISKWDCFHHPWRDTEENVVEDAEERHRRHVAMIESFHRRSEIYRRGGRGWWSPNDESKLKWPPIVVKKREPDRSFAKKGQFIEEMKAWRNNIR